MKARERTIDAFGGIAGGTKDAEKSSQPSAYKAHNTIFWLTIAIYVDGSRTIRTGNGKTTGKWREYNCRVHSNLSIFSPVISQSRQRRAKMRPFLTVVNRTSRPHWDRAIALLMSPPWEISKIFAAKKHMEKLVFEFV